MAVVSSRRAPQHWAIWTNRTVVVATFLLVDSVVALWVTLEFVNYRADRRAWLVGLLLLIVAMVFEEGATSLARMKWRLGSDLKRDMTSVWAVAAAVALPPVPAIVLVSLVYLHVWWRQRRPSGSPAHRTLYSGASVVIGCLCAGYSARTLLGSDLGTSWALTATLAVVVAIMVYTTVNRSLITVGLTLLGASWRDLVGTVDDNLTELSTLCLGGLVAIAAINEPWLSVLAILPMAMLQRGSFVREIEKAAVTDAKTGLLNAVGWEHLAQREIARARREKYDVSVLIIDIDHFKLVNDRHGHIVGDQVLRGLGKTLAAALREYDTVARFGGEEFVAVLPETGRHVALEVAERIRALVNAVTVASVSDCESEDVLSVSIGVDSAGGPELATTDLTAMLVAADRALYRAKGSGRNRVCLAGDAGDEVDLQSA